MYNKFIIDTKNYTVVSYVKKSPPSAKFHYENINAGLNMGLPSDLKQ